MRHWLLLAPSLLIAPAALVSAAPDAAAQARPAAFNQCAVCHKVDKSRKHGIGPNLFGIYGEKAGAAPGFKFSPAMKRWGRKLDAATLDAFIASPRKSVPGTKMAYAGLRDPAKRKEIIAWLKKQK